MPEHLRTRDTVGLVVVLVGVVVAALGLVFDWVTFTAELERGGEAPAETLGAFDQSDGVVVAVALALGALATGVQLVERRRLLHLLALLVGVLVTVIGVVDLLDVLSVEAVDQPELGIDARREVGAGLPLVIAGGALIVLGTGATFLDGAARRDAGAEGDVDEGASEGAREDADGLPPGGSRAQERSGPGDADEPGDTLDV